MLGERTRVHLSLIREMNRHRLLAELDGGAVYVSPQWREACQHLPSRLWAEMIHSVFMIGSIESDKPPDYCNVWG